MKICEVSSNGGGGGGGGGGNREVSAWSYSSSMVSAGRAHAPLTLFNHSELAVRFAHVESREQFRHRAANMRVKMRSYSKSCKKMQPNLVSV